MVHMEATATLTKQLSIFDIEIPVSPALPVWQIAVLDPNQTDHWMECHKAGCQHLARGQKGRNAWTISAATRVAAADDVAGDFIDPEDPSSTAEAFATNHIHWAPCLKGLPLS